MKAENKQQKAEFMAADSPDFRPENVRSRTFGVNMRKFTATEGREIYSVVDGKEWDQSGNTYDFSKVADLVLKESHT